MNTPFKISRRSFVLSAVCLAACKPGSAVLELTGSTMGTTYNIVAVDHDGSVNKAELQSQIDSALGQINALMSNWDAGSEVSRFNHDAGTAPMTVSQELAQVVAAAEDVHSKTDGYFEIGRAHV